MTFDLLRPRISLPIFCLFLISCTKVNVVGPQGPAGPPGDTGYLSKGAIQGSVYLFDVYGNPLPSDSGATVSIDNTSPLLQTITGINGGFTIPSVPSGTYDLTVAKQGFGTMRLLGFQNAGSASGTYAPQLKTAVIPQYTIKSASIDTLSVQGNPYSPVVPEIWAFLIVQVTDTAVLQFPVITYFYDSANVSPTHYLYYNSYAYSKKNDSTLWLGLEGSFSSSRLANAPYLYIMFAIDNPLSLSYVDENGTTIFPCEGSVSQVYKVYNNLK